MTDLPLGDDSARTAIAQDLGSTLFVEAGAGSGKTTALVGRVLALISSGVELRHIAAITFTEKAAAELRDRLRQRLESAAEEAESGGDLEDAERMRAAIDQLDGSAIGTLHAFAQRILSEHPIEAGLPPRVEVLDEVASEVAFDRRWSAFRDGLLEDEAVERTLLLLFAAGVKPDALRSLAVTFEQNWDLVEERVPAEAPDPPSLRAEAARALDRLDALCLQADECSDPADKLAVRLREVADYIGALRGVDELDLVEELKGDGQHKAPSFKAGTIGAAKNWPDKTYVQTELREAGEALGAVVDQVAERCVRRLGTELRRFTLDSAHERRSSGRLSFHDLLVLARTLLRDPEHGPAVRARLHDRYRRLLLDEFQDTDPIQIELAVRIAAADPTGPDAGTKPWHEVPVTPGQLFFVGDPKQSIYRFRRADVALFRAASQRVNSEGSVLSLTTNFRTVEPIIGWVNATFGSLMGVPDPAIAAATGGTQVDYAALDAHRPEPPTGPAVSVIGRDERTDLPRAGSAQLRASEAAEVAATVLRVVAEGWAVGDDNAADGWRPARLGDVTILVPARTSLPFLEDALDQAGVAYRAETSSLVYASAAVRDLLMALRAVADPTDALAVTTALRSPLFGCGDDDLFEFKVLQRGHWNYLAPQPDTVADGPVAEALGALAALHRDRQFASPAQLLERLARDRRMFEVGFVQGRTRDVWRRLRWVIDQARGWSDATGGGLRDYLAWVGRQAVEGTRVAEAVLPETDDDAVRIMTIHAAKGLEFPVTILSGMSTRPMTRRASAEVVFPPEGGGVGYAFGNRVRTEEFVEHLALDEQLGFDERVRLLYVACTRAKDHLVVSLARQARASAPKDPTKRTNAELLVDGMGDLLNDLPDAVDELDGHLGSPADAAAPEAPEPFEEWSAALAQVLHRASRPTTVAATALTAEGAPDPEAPPALALAPTPTPDPDPDPDDPEPAEAGSSKRPRDLDLSPWLKGRYGTAVGRAVHATLQTIDLATGEGLESAAIAQCQAEAIPRRLDDVVALTRAALGAPVVRAAAAGPHWREVYACTPTDGGRLLEGYVDLLARIDGELVVVDYKTAGSSDPDDLARRTDGYRLQGAAYAVAVAQASREPVSRVCFVYLTPDGAVEHDLADLPAAVDEVTALVARGAEILTP